MDLHLKEGVAGDTNHNHITVGVERRNSILQAVMGEKVSIHSKNLMKIAAKSQDMKEVRCSDIKATEINNNVEATGKQNGGQMMIQLLT